MQIKHTLKLYIQSQTADSAPPLGTILGNLGVNTVNFCKEFNAYTKNLPPYITLSVQLNIYSNRSLKFSISEPPLSSIINLMLKEDSVTKNGKIIKYKSINLKNVIQLSKMKFPKKTLSQSLAVILGVLKSFDVKICN